MGGGGGVWGVDEVRNSLLSRAWVHEMKKTRAVLCFWILAGKGGMLGSGE